VFSASVGQHQALDICKPLHCIQILRVGCGVCDVLIGPQRGVFVRKIYRQSRFTKLAPATVICTGTRHTVYLLACNKLQRPSLLAYSHRLRTRISTGASVTRIRTAAPHCHANAKGLNAPL
jgi:hypothetical protein